jgi:subtilisin family serine protease
MKFNKNISLILILASLVPGFVFATNDKFYYDQKYLSQIGYSDYIRSISKGSGVIVAVIDEGVWQEHPDLSHSTWVNTKEIPQNQKDDDGDGLIDDYYGWNYIDNNGDLSPKGSHGTAVAGIIAANQNNGIGIAGIAPETKIMSIIACADKIGCPNQSIIKAIYFAADHGANIINLSLGGSGYVGYSTDFDAAIKYAYEHDVVIIASAGNGDVASLGQVGQNLSFVKASPVNNDVNWLNMVLGVGASNGNGHRTNWTNYGAGVDTYAPGEDVVTTVVPAFSGGFGYDGTLSGTSFSAPMVAGAAALLKSYKPELRNWEIVSRILQNGPFLHVENLLKAQQLPCSLSKVTTLDVNAGSNVFLEGKNLNTKIKLRIQKDGNAVSSIGNALKFLDDSRALIDTSSLGLTNGVYRLISDSDVSVCTIGTLDFTVYGANISQQPQPIIKDETPVIIKYTITARALNVRSLPKTNGKVIGYTKSKGKYQIIEQTNGWTKISLDKKRSGWVLSKNIKIIN